MKFCILFQKDQVNQSQWNPEKEGMLDWKGEEWMIESLNKYANITSIPMLATYGLYGIRNNIEIKIKGKRNVHKREFTYWFGEYYQGFPSPYYCSNFYPWKLGSSATHRVITNLAITDVELYKKWLRWIERAHLAHT